MLVLRARYGYCGVCGEVLRVARAGISVWWSGADWSLGIMFLLSGV